MSKRGGVIIRTRKPKGRPLTEEEAAIAGTPPSEAFGGGVGTKFGEAAQKAWQSSVNPSQFLEGQVYGDLLRIDSKVLAKKRTVVQNALGKVVTAIVWLIEKEEGGVELPSFASVRKEAYEIIHGWRELVGKNPHVWPRSPIFDYIIELRGLCNAVDKSCGSALSEEMPERFKSWSEREKTFLPSEPLHNFLSINLAAAYPYMRDLYQYSSVIVSEFCSPPYAWNLAIVTNIRKTLQTAGFAPDGLADSIKAWAHSEIHNQYLAKLGIIDHHLDFMKLLPSLGRTANMSTATNLMRGMLERRDISTQVFGSEAVKDMGDLYEEMRTVQAPFTEASERPPPLVAAAAAAPSATATTPPPVEGEEEEEASSPPVEDGEAAASERP
ncbi:MAG: hypothetical protein WC483_02145 [Candidatus Paceibacterota bacterium]